MNLVGIVSSLVGGVNPLITANWLTSGESYTYLPDGTQVPTYKGGIQIPIQIQALTAQELSKLDGLNVQGVKRAVYIEGQAAGVIRCDTRGGDLLIFPDVPGGLNKTWLAVLALETWPDWVKLAVVLQNDPSS